MINDAKVFESTFQGSLAKEFPQLKKAADMERLSQNENIAIIQSLGGVRFQSFAKSDSFKKGTYLGIGIYRNVALNFTGVWHGGIVYLGTSTYELMGQFIYILIVQDRRVFRILSWGGCKLSTYF